MTSFLDVVRERVVIYDGATGTALQRAGLGDDDFGGPNLAGCNEVLNVTRPDVIAALHAGYFAAGADVVETNTFGAFAVPLAEYGIPDRAYELAHAAAHIAAGVAADHSTPERRRFVAGSIGPGTKLPSLGQVRYLALRDAYRPLARGLLDGGVDLFIIETMYDLLTVKAAVAACRLEMAAAGRAVPLQVQVTIETTGRMLPGTEIGAALAAIDPLRPDIIGLNCATGPEEMHEHLRYLARHSRVPISVIPNAGLPEIRDGDTHYGLTPDDLADHLERFITEHGVRVVGGCCGTTEDHIAEVVRRCSGLEPADRRPVHEPGAASLYSFTPFRQDTSFLIVGERTNANGSKQFREALLAEDWEACLAVARDQVAESAHMIDVCVDYVGRDGVADMDELTARFASQVPVPLVIDSTEPAVMEAALQRIGGRAVLNSANLEDGDAPGSRADRVFTLAKEHGAAVICLLIDEEGQARDADWKLRVAHRLYDLATSRYGLEPGDLLFDALTFPLSTGDDDLRGDAVETITAIRRIKEELPGVFTVLGVSNVSFGLNPAARHVLNSVFLHECLDAGLDAAIMHAGRIVPLNRIDDRHRSICLDLVYDRHREQGDPLAALIDAFRDVRAAAGPVEDRSDWPVERRLIGRIVDGDASGLEADLDEALVGRDPIEVINDVLLVGMKEVGDLFASGAMQLPFVLRSAETMKAAVGHLEPLMATVERNRRGSIVLATVKGDVHDIGKNLVDIILTNNGFTVHNLGIKVGISEMIEKADEVGADAIGMSGLLVKSTVVMGDNLDELTRRGRGDTPVLLGGAALTRRYVEEDLRRRYPGPLFYGKDAFAGLEVMQALADHRAGRIDAAELETRTRTARERPARPVPDRTPVAVPRRSPDVAADNPVFRPPFLGTRIVKGIAIDEIAGYLNLTALYRNQWQYRPTDRETDAEFKARLRPILNEQLSKVREDDLLVPQVVYGYFPANGDGDDLVIWVDDQRSTERMRFSFPRQRVEPWLCISDFFRPVESGELDFACFHIVTMGDRASARAAELFAADRYQDYLHLHGLGVEMAEALAEYWHRRIRIEWGFGDEDGPTLHGLFRQQYRGGRYSWGYPACPDLEDNAKVAHLLEADRIGLTVGEETGFQYQPEQTTSALICHHPRAKYFIAGKERG